MDNLIKLIRTILENLNQSPGALLSNMVAIFFAVLTYLTVTYFPSLIQYVQSTSTTAVIIEMKKQRELEFPDIAREKIMALYLQTDASAVYVTKYEPEALNDYQKILTWEGKIPLEKIDYEPRPVDKSSNLYTTQLAGSNFVFYSNKEERYILGRNLPTLKNQSFEFVYTCPYFNLNNIYSGYIGIAWDKIPVKDEDLPKYEEYLGKLCAAPARHLGRSIG